MIERALLDLRGVARRALGVALLLGLASGLARAQPSSEAPASPLQPPAPALGEIGRLSFAPVDSSSIPVGIRTRVRPAAEAGQWEIIPLRVGRVGVALPRADGVADTLWWEVPARLAEGELGEPQPLRSVGVLRPNWWPSILLILALLAPVAFLLWRLRRPRGAGEGAFPLMAEPAHLEALRKLAELRAGGLLDRGEFDSYYVQASHAVRSYIAGRFRVPALDWTSNEVADRLRDAGYDRQIVSEVHPLLLSADRVKFAGERPSVHAAHEWIGIAERWIDETKIEPTYTTRESVAAAVRFSQGGRAA